MRVILLRYIPTTAYNKSRQLQGQDFRSVNRIRRLLQKKLKMRDRKIKPCNQIADTSEVSSVSGLKKYPRIFVSVCDDESQLADAIAKCKTNDESSFVISPIAYISGAKTMKPFSQASKKPNDSAISSGCAGVYLSVGENIHAINRARSIACQIAYWVKGLSVNVKDVIGPPALPKEERSRRKRERKLKRQSPIRSATSAFGYRLFKADRLSA